MQITVNLALGLLEIHENGIQHRDFKPANILISEEAGHEIFKLTDFGISKYSMATMQMNTTSGLTGTIDFCSPERLKGESNSLKEDVWALGVTIY